MTNRVITTTALVLLSATVAHALCLANIPTAM
jgi:hypothetical protein